MIIINKSFHVSMQDRGVDSADLISFMLELSFHVTGEVLYSNEEIKII